MDVVWSLMWFVLFLALIAGLVLFVIALIRWEMNSWKYLLLALGVLLPFVGAVVGWVALFAGGVNRRPAIAALAASSPLPPPPPPNA